MKTKKGLLIFTVFGWTGDDISTISTVVAAAASVPFSSTLRTAWCSTLTLLSYGWDNWMRTWMITYISKYGSSKCTTCAHVMLCNMSCTYLWYFHFLPSHSGKVCRIRESTYNTNCLQGIFQWIFARNGVFWHVNSHRAEIETDIHNSLFKMKIISWMCTLILMYNCQKIVMALNYYLDSPSIANAQCFKWCRQMLSSTSFIFPSSGRTMIIDALPLYGSLSTVVKFSLSS